MAITDWNLSLEQFLDLPRQSPPSNTTRRVTATARLSGRR
jgi:hypothetical protein